MSDIDFPPKKKNVRLIFLFLKILNPYMYLQPLRRCFLILSRKNFLSQMPQKKILSSLFLLPAISRSFPVFLSTRYFNNGKSVQPNGDTIRSRGLFLIHPIQAKRSNNIKTKKKRSLKRQLFAHKRFISNEMPKIIASPRNVFSFKEKNTRRFQI